MTIDLARLQNFQSHKKTILKFSERMNVIYGPSDNGKSAFLRGIRLVVTNRPNGEKFRSHDTDKTICGLKTKTFSVKRVRSDTKNEYVVGKKSYKALRMAVPDDISIPLNLSEVNIQTQDDVYFLIDKSPGKVSKVLNEVAGLEVMDKVIQSTNKKVRSVSSEVNSTNKSLMTVQESIYELDWVEASNIELKELEALSSKIQKSVNEYAEINDILKSLKVLQNSKDSMLSDDLILDLKSLIKVRDLIDEKECDHDDLLAKLDLIDELEEQLANVDLIDVTELDNLRIHIESKECKLDSVQSIIDNIDSLKSKHIQAIERVKKANKAFKTSLSKYDICPTCDRKL